MASLGRSSTRRFRSEMVSTPRSWLVFSARGDGVGVVTGRRVEPLDAVLLEVLLWLRPRTASSGQVWIPSRRGGPASPWPCTPSRGLSRLTRAPGARPRCRRGRFCLSPSRRRPGGPDRADETGLVPTEAEVPYREPDDGVHGPRVQRPMEVRVLYPQLGRLRGGRLRHAEGRGAVMREGLGNAPEDEGWPHPGLEHHGEPRERAELGPLTLLAQPELPVTAEGQ